jgi:hypothetical protein
MALVHLVVGEPMVSMAMWVTTEAVHMAGMHTQMEAAKDD